MTTLSEDTIRKAVEIAPGFQHHIDPNGELWLAPIDVHRPHVNGSSLWIWDEAPQPILDALAAALVRVVDALDDPPCIDFQPSYTSIFRPDKLPYNDICRGTGPDRIENTINAIVEFAEKHPEVFK